MLEGVMRLPPLLSQSGLTSLIMKDKPFMKIFFRSFFRI